jgi:hypothetical protein
MLPQICLKIRQVVVESSSPLFIFTFTRPRQCGMTAPLGVVTGRGQAQKSFEVSEVSTCWEICVANSSRVKKYASRVMKYSSLSSPSRSGIVSTWTHIGQRRAHLSGSSAQWEYAQSFPCLSWSSLVAVAVDAESEHSEPQIVEDSDSSPRSDS